MATGGSDLRFRLAELGKHRLPGLIIVSALLLGIRVALAALIPMTGDEANFVVWAKHLAGGYHEHPPMIGWILAALLTLGDSAVWLRMPIVIFPTIVAYYLWRKTRNEHISTYFQLVPLHLIPVLMTTDTALLIWASLAYAAFDRALRTKRTTHFAQAGLALGCAFLSKYFAVFIIPAFALALVWRRASQRDWLGFVVMLLAASPAALYHLGWNLTHCMVNLRLHMASPTQDVLGFLWMHAYLAAPVVPLLAARTTKPIPENAKLALAFWLVPTAIFGVSSLTVGQSLQWAIPFTLGGYLAAGLIVSPQALCRALPILAVVSAAHLGFALWFVLTPVTKFAWHPQFKSLAFIREGVAFARAAEQAWPHAVLAADSSALASLAAYHLRKDVPVFGEGTNHGREDDRIADWRQLNGRDIAVISRDPPRADLMGPYFDRVKTREINVAGASFTLSLGEGFNYASYRQGILARVAQRYYAPLRQVPGYGCYFAERYSVR